MNPHKQETLQVTKKLTPEEFRQFATWLINALRPKLPLYIQKDLDDGLSENSSLGVDIMIMNLEITLDEMQKKAKDEGKKEVALAALKKDCLLKLLLILLD